jgi:putative membrane protein
MRLMIGAATLAGTAAVIALAAIAGFPTVATALATARWGILAATLLHLSTVLSCAAAWRALMPPHWRRPFFALSLFRWVREGVNSLLPVAQVGGVFVQARLLSLRGAPGAFAGASVVVDLTIEVTTLLLFALLGLGLLVTGERPVPDAGSLGFGVALGIPAIIGFVAVQRLGLVTSLSRFSERLARRGGRPLSDSLRALDAAIHTLYQTRWRLAAAAAFHFAAWLLSAVEVGLLLRFMGEPVGARDTLIVASLGYAVRSFGFLVPGALGIQEGGFMLLATWVGIPAPVGLALSLARRVRELLLGVPALLAWQLIEGRRLWSGLSAPLSETTSSPTASRNGDRPDDSTT